MLLWSRRNFLITCLQIKSHFPECEKVLTPEESPVYRINIKGFLAPEELPVLGHKGFFPVPSLIV